MSKKRQEIVEPLADRVAIRPAVDTNERTAGGLYIPEVAKEKPVRGDVIAVGPGRTERGVLIPVALKGPAPESEPEEQK